MSGPLAGLPTRQTQVEAPASEGPDPGFFSIFGASTRTAVDEEDLPQISRLGEGYNALERSLVDLGVDPQSLRTRKAMPANVTAYSFGGANPVYDELDRDKVWEAISAQRTANPKAFPKLPDTRADYEQWVLRRYGARDRDQAVTGRAQGVKGFTANLLGGAVGSFTDPINIATLPIGGGAKTLGKTILFEGILNAGVEAVQTPAMVAARKRLGEKTSARDIAINIGSAGVGGAALSGLGKGAELYLLPGLKAKAVAMREAGKPLDRKLAEALDKAEIDDDLGDVMLADLAEAVIGRDNLTPDERASIAAIRAAEFHEKQNPFVANPAGDAAFDANIKAAMDAVLRDVPKGRPRAITPMTAPQVRVERIVSPDTAQPQRVAARPTKRGKTGYAIDVYQYFRDKGLSEAQARGIAAGIHAESRSDHNVRGGYKGRAVGLGQWLGPRRAELLRRNGSRPTRRQQLDFLWEELQGRDPGGAKVLAQKDEAAVLRSYITDFMRPAKGAETTGDMKRGMAALGRGGEHWGGPSDAGRIELRADKFSVDEQGLRDRLQVEIDRIQMDIDDLASGRGVDEKDADIALPDLAARADGDDDWGWQVEDDAAQAGQPFVPPARGDGAEESLGVPPPAPPVLDLLPRVAAMVDDPARPSLMAAKLARRLDAPEEDVRAALAMVAARDQSLTMSARGEVRRVPREGPLDLLKFIARNGGLRDDEGHDLKTIFETTIRNRRYDKGGKVKSAWDQRSTAFIPGAGKLIRRDGMSVDDVGELIHEAGYWTGTTRPSTAEVLDILDRAYRGGEKIYAMDDLAKVEARAVRDAGVDPEYLDYMSREVEWLSRENDFDLSTDEIDEIARFSIDNGVEGLEGVEAWFLARFERDLSDADFETGDIADDLLEGVTYESRAHFDGPPDGRFADGDFEPGDERGNPYAGDADAGAWTEDFGGPRSPFEGLDDPDWTNPAWDAVDGAGPKAQADSLEHDARLIAGAVDDAEDMFGGATGDDVRQSLERQMEGRQQARVTQKAPGEDGGLFDVQDDTGNLFDDGFSFVDETGAERSLRDVLDEFDADEADIKTIRDCL